jgi:hypothetical protein
MSIFTWKCGQVLDSTRTLNVDNVKYLLKFVQAGDDIIKAPTRSPATISNRTGGEVLNVHVLCLFSPLLKLPLFISQYSIWMQNGRPESIPGWGKSFSSSLCVQTTSEAHPASYPMVTEGSFVGGEARPGRDADHSPPSSQEWVGAIPPLPLAACTMYRHNFTFFLLIYRLCDATHLFCLFTEYFSKEEWNCFTSTNCTTLGYYINCLPK